MLLENVRIEQLASCLAEAGDRPVWPGLHHINDRDRLRIRLEGSEHWDRLANVAKPEPIDVLPRSMFRQFKREGIRNSYEQLYNDRRECTESAAFAVWLNHPVAELDYLQDLLWAWCETTAWIMPAHEMHPSGLELGSTRVGRTLAEIIYLLQDDLEPEVYQRVASEIDRRMLDAASDWRRPNRWASKPTNWNHVCNANLIQIALYRIEDPFTLAHFIHPLIQRMDYALDGFARDGGCLEGPGYWRYGFGHYVEAAITVHQRTAGEINLMDDPRIPAISRYPLAVHFDAEHRVTVSDADDGRVDAVVALCINHLHPLPELYSLTRSRADGGLDLHSWRALAMEKGESPAGELSVHDALLPDTGLARIVAANDPTTQLAITAGHNGMPHNHTDVGSFIYFRRGRAVFTDPGAPRYTADTFGRNRYRIVHCRSLGHSVPLINGHEQAVGGEYSGTLHVLHLNGQAEAGAAVDVKLAVAELGQAYAEPTLRLLTRTFELRPDGELCIRDVFDFTDPPTSLDEGFVTFDAVTVSEDARSVQFGEGSDAVTLRAADETRGTFAVGDLAESVEQGRDGRLLRRVTFNPEALAAQMTLVFIAG